MPPHVLIKKQCKAIPNSFHNFLHFVHFGISQFFYALTAILTRGREEPGGLTHMDLMDKLASLAQRYEELNALMAQPEILDDISMLQRYGREHAELEEVVNKYHEIVDNDRQIAEAQEMFESDDLEMRDLAFEELERLKARREKLLEEVKILLLPKDIMDDKNAIVTIQAGAGGDEAALFAGELFRMYTRYAESKRWKIEILDINETGQGGIKDITFVVKGKIGRASCR